MTTSGMFLIILVAIWYALKSLTRHWKGKKTAIVSYSRPVDDDRLK